MGVQTEIDRIITAVRSAHKKVAEKGGTTSEPYLIADLERAIDSIPNIDTDSTLPPPVGSVIATGANESITVSFEAVGSEYEEYLGDTAYIVVLKEGSVPENPNDGIVIKLDKSGAVIG